jgi:glycosyltransferase involved in cell wall biosynthesis
VTGTVGLRTALLNFAYWPEVRRGNERLVHDVATELARRGHDTAIVTSHPGPSTETTEEGVRVIRSRRPPDLPLRLRRFQDHLTHLPGSYRALGRLRPEVAHAFFPTDALAAVRWAERHDAVAVHTLTGIPGRENISNLRMRRRILEETTTRADAVVVISNAAREAAWRWLASEPEVIYPGVDLTRFRPGEKAEVPTIACAADPDDQRKRVGLLIEAFRRLRRNRQDVELLLIRPADPAYAAELEAEPGVSLRPSDSDSAPAMFAEAWASALFSTREAFGLVVVESLACGTPVAVTRDSALPEIIDRPSVGSLFEGADVESAARSLDAALELAGDPGTADHCVSRARDFSIDRSARRHEELYRRLLGHKG